MKMSDILRTMADKMDAIETGGQEQAPAALEPVGTDSQEQPDQGTMIPPLQQKLELLKKASGVESAFDGQGANDELQDIKQLSGIKTVIQQEAGEDNDVLG